MFTDEEHQRYHWIKKHRGKMSLVRAQRRKNKGVRADRYTGSADTSMKNLQEEEPCCCAQDGKYSTIVLDSSGNRWMERWNKAFRALEIDHLRSPMFFHVDPGDRDGLLAYTRETGREKELCELSGCVGHEMSKHKRKKMRNQSQYASCNHKNVFFLFILTDGNVQIPTRGGNQRTRPKGLLHTFNKALCRLLCIYHRTIWIERDGPDPPIGC